MKYQQRKAARAAKAEANGHGRTKALDPIESREVRAAKRAAGLMEENEALRKRLEVAEASRESLLRDLGESDAALKDARTELANVSEALKSARADLDALTAPKASA